MVELTSRQRELVRKLCRETTFCTVADLAMSSMRQHVPFAATFARWSLSWPNMAPLSKGPRDGHPPLMCIGNASRLASTGQSCRAAYPQHNGTVRRRGATPLA